MLLANTSLHRRSHTYLPKYLRIPKRASLELYPHHRKRPPSPVITGEALENGHNSFPRRCEYGNGNIASPADAGEVPNAVRQWGAPVTHATFYRKNLSTLQSK